MSLDFIRSAREVAKTWRDFTPGPHHNDENASVFASWIEGEGAPLLKLYDAWDSIFEVDPSPPIFKQMSSKDHPAEWWVDALFLFIAADEAARNLGFTVSEEPDRPWLISAADDVYFNKAKTLGSRGRGATVVFDGVSTISAANQDVVSVVPKARTTPVGCTLRSLSHHLALLPPRGIARAAWAPYWFPAPPDERHMNLLLVPFPFTIPANAFEPMQGYAGEGAKRWGSFGMKQTWLSSVTKDKLLEFVKALVVGSCREVDAIHGIIFPELALNEDVWEHLQSSLPSTFPELEFIVGSVSAENGRHGNFVRVVVFQRGPATSGPIDQASRIVMLSTREKHHRWTLDRDEILVYGLEGRLSPSLAWAEDIDLLSRRVDFSVIRQSSVISAMICEDLARVDPCQEVIRAIGPRIVFALLMDAPQLKARWPARYATILAEDPGSAVLTLTSRGLMTRQHRLGKFPSSGGADRIVAPWRDDEQNNPIEIECPMDCHAVRLTPSGLPVVDRSLDGREDRSAVAWRYAHHRPVCLNGITKEFSDVLGTDDLALQPPNRGASAP